MRMSTCLHSTLLILDHVHALLHLESEPIRFKQAASSREGGVGGFARHHIVAAAAQPYSHSRVCYGSRVVTMYPRSYRHREAPRKHRDRQITMLHPANKSDHKRQIISSKIQLTNEST